MKVIVRKDFIDVHTDALHECGELMDVTEERLKEIQRIDPGLVEVVKERKKVERI